MAASRAVLGGQVIPAYAKTAGRAVHVKVHPQPLDLAESREVLRVLQQYGEVIMYKHLKHEPNLHAANTALAIYQSIASAQDVINASPLRYELKRRVARPGPSGSSGSVQILATEEKHENTQVNDEQEQPENSNDKEWLKSLAKGRGIMREGPVGTVSFTDFDASPRSRHPPNIQATSIPTPTPRTPRPFTSNPMPSSTTLTTLPFSPSPSASSASPSLEPKEDSKEFQLTVTRSVLNHHAYIKRQHYYGAFHLDRMNIMAEDLEARVPVKGMMDCQISKGEAPLRVRMKKNKDEDKEDKGNRTLRSLWEEGRREREEIASKDAFVP